MSKAAKVGKAASGSALAVIGGSRQPSRPPIHSSFTSTKLFKMPVESEDDVEFKDIGEGSVPAATEVTESVAADDDYDLVAGEFLVAWNSEYPIKLAQAKMALWTAKNCYNTICNMYKVEMEKEWPGHEEYEDL